jgi:pimeloyl-ACP methyl ester carboxylesterase
MMEWVASILLEVSIPIAIATNRGVISKDLRPVPSKIDGRVLILQGDKDQSAPVEITGRRTAAGIKGAVLRSIPVDLTACL